MIARSRGKGAIVATWRLFCHFPEPAPVVVASALFPSKLPKLSVCRGGRGNLITSTDRCLFCSNWRSAEFFQILKIMPCHVWTALSLTDTLALYKKSIKTKISLCNGSSSLQCFWRRRALLIPATSPVHGKTPKRGRRLKEPRIAWSRTRPFMFALYKPCQRYCIYLLLPIWGVQRVLNLLITHLLLPIWQAPSEQNTSFIFSPACSRSMHKTPIIPFIFVQTVFLAANVCVLACRKQATFRMKPNWWKSSTFISYTFYLTRC